MRRDVPIRRLGMQVRRQPIRRASPRARPAQRYALILMLLCTLATLVLMASPAMTARRIVIHGARFTGEQLVRQIAGIDSAPNLFRLRTDGIADRLVHLPAVESAKVEVQLPDTVVVTVVERQPRIVWVVGDRRYVADQTGFLFGLVDESGNPQPPSWQELPSPTPNPSPAGDKSPATQTPGPSTTPEAGGGETNRPAATGLPGARPSILPVATPLAVAPAVAGAVMLPTVYDRRVSGARLRLGGVVDLIALDAGYRLGSLSPADVGSTARSLDVVVDDWHGFTLAAPARGWVAEFGFYSESLRKVMVIPGQVRDLRSVLAWAGEDRVAWIWLMADISDSHTISYLPK